MKENYNVRQIVLEDYPTIDKWHEQYGEKKPKSSLLPLGGLGGFIIEKNQVPVAAIYLYVTNSSMGYFDFLISDPNYREKDRFEIIMALFHYCTERAILAGCKCVFVTTAIPGVISKMKELGLREDLICEDKKRVIIYTYEKTNKIFS